MNRQSLTLDEDHILDRQVIPTAKRWVLDWPIGSSLFEHGRRTLEHWGALSDRDVAGRMAQARAESDERERQRKERAEFNRGQ